MAEISALVWRGWRARRLPTFQRLSKIILNTQISFLCCQNKKQQIRKFQLGFLGVSTLMRAKNFSKIFTSDHFQKICKFGFSKKFTAWKIKGRGPYVPIMMAPWVLDLTCIHPRCALTPSPPIPKKIPRKKISHRSEGKNTVHKT